MPATHGHGRDALGSRISRVLEGPGDSRWPTLDGASKLIYESDDLGGRLLEQERRSWPQ